MGMYEVIATSQCDGSRHRVNRESDSSNLPLLHIFMVAFANTRAFLGFAGQLIIVLGSTSTLNLGNRFRLRIDETQLKTLKDQCRALHS